MLSKPGSVRGMHETLFSLNVAFAVSYAILGYAFTLFDTQYAPAPHTAIKYFFLRGAARVNSVLHLAPQSQIGQELTFTVSVTALGLLFLFLLRLLAGTRAFRVLLSTVAGIAAIMAVPATLVYVAHITSTARSLLSSETIPFWSKPAFTAFAGYFLLVSTILWFARRHLLRIRLYTILLTIHYALWSCVFWLQPSQSHLFSQGAFVVLLACCGPVWVFYLEQSRENSGETEAPGKKWALGFALVGLSLLLALWMPVGGYSLATAKDPRSITVTMQRRGCFGHCPVYTVTIHGTGQVEYSGAREVKVKGSQATMLPPEEVTRVLQGLDRVRFFTLDDAAFERCPDSELVSLSVGVDGRYKTVNADTFCVGSRSGPQAQLVMLAKEIDGIVGSEQWVRCDGKCST